LAKARADLAALRADLASGRAVRAEVLVIPYRIRTPMAIYPDIVRSYASHHNGIFGFDLDRQRADDLIRAINGAKLKAEVDKWGSDLRWGAIFFDQSGTQIHAIYLNSCYVGGAGRRGHIDGARVQLNRSLIAWFESNFSNRDGPCVDDPPDRRNKAK
jgi:hypothetical protein